MSKKSLPPQEVLAELLRYDPDTGNLFWRKRASHLFKDGRHSAEHIARRWNSKNANCEAFTALDNYGYRQGTILGRHVRAHLVIWALVHGDLPDGHIDHINHDKADNRLNNLRQVSHQGNKRNVGRSRANRSGVVGVIWCQNRWQAYITVDAKSIYLGRFANKDQAVAARKAAEQQHGFHDNHGM